MDLTQDVGYVEKEKVDFGAAATRLLKKVAASLELAEKKITWNKGGIAVSGEVVLMGMYDMSEKKGVYISISTPSHHGIMFRTITHMKDYTGGPNQWVQPKGMSYADIADHIFQGTFKEKFKERSAGYRSNARPACSCGDSSHVESH